MYDHAAADAHGRDSSLVWTIVVDHRVFEGDPRGPLSRILRDRTVPYQRDAVRSGDLAPSDEAMGIRPLFGSSTD